MPRHIVAPHSQPCRSRAQSHQSQPQHAQGHRQTRRPQALASVQMEGARDQPVDQRRLAVIGLPLTAGHDVVAALHHGTGGQYAPAFLTLQLGMTEPGQVEHGPEQYDYQVSQHGRSPPPVQMPRQALALSNSKSAGSRAKHPASGVASCPTAWPAGPRSWRYAAVAAR